METKQHALSDCSTQYLRSTQTKQAKAPSGGFNASFNATCDRIEAMILRYFSCHSALNHSSESSTITSVPLRQPKKPPDPPHLEEKDDYLLEISGEQQVYYQKENAPVFDIPADPRPEQSWRCRQIPIKHTYRKTRFKTPKRTLDGLRFENGETSQERFWSVRIVGMKRNSYDDKRTTQRRLAQACKSLGVKQGTSLFGSVDGIVAEEKLIGVTEHVSHMIIFNPCFVENGLTGFHGESVKKLEPDDVHIEDNGEQKLFNKETQPMEALPPLSSDFSCEFIHITAHFEDDAMSLGSETQGEPIVDGKQLLKVSDGLTTKHLDHFVGKVAAEIDFDADIVFLEDRNDLLDSYDSHSKRKIMLSHEDSRQHADEKTLAERIWEPGGLSAKELQWHWTEKFHSKDDTLQLTPKLHMTQTCPLLPRDALFIITKGPEAKQVQNDNYDRVGSRGLVYDGCNLPESSFVVFVEDNWYGKMLLAPYQKNFQSNDSRSIRHILLLVNEEANVWCLWHNIEIFLSPRLLHDKAKSVFAGLKADQTIPVTPELEPVFVSSKEAYIMFVSVVKWKHKEISKAGYLYGSHYAEQTCHCCDVKQLIREDMEYYTKHKWKSKQLQTDPICMTNHPSGLAELKLKESLTNFGFDVSKICIDTHGELLVHIKLSGEVTYVLIFLIGPRVRSKRKGRNQAKVAQDMCKLRDTKLIFISDAFKKKYKDEVWLFMWNILNELCEANFKMATKTVKKSLEELCRLRIEKLHHRDIVEPELCPYHAHKVVTDVLNPLWIFPTACLLKDVLYYWIDWRELINWEDDDQMLSVVRHASLYLGQQNEAEQLGKHMICFKSLELIQDDITNAFELIPAMKFGAVSFHNTLFDFLYGSLPRPPEVYHSDSSDTYDPEFDFWLIKLQKLLDAGQLMQSQLVYGEEKNVLKDVAAGVCYGSYSAKQTYKCSFYGPSYQWKEHPPDQASVQVYHFFILEDKDMLKRGVLLHELWFSYLIPVYYFGYVFGYIFPI